MDDRVITAEDDYDRYPHRLHTWSVDRGARLVARPTECGAWLEVRHEDMGTVFLPKKFFECQGPGSHLCLLLLH